MIANRAERSVNLRNGRQFASAERRTISSNNSAGDDLECRINAFQQSAGTALGLEPFDTQLEAIRGLVAGQVVEMATGEGKTLAIAGAAAVMAMAGRRVHVMTVNPYLAERDYDWLNPLFRALDLEVAYLAQDADFSARREIYSADIVYGVGSEFGFDYLRDQQRLVSTSNERLGSALSGRWRSSRESIPPTVQTSLDVAIVDEIDSVLIDEARSALILSDASQTPCAEPAAYQYAAAAVNSMELGKDFQIEPRNHQLQLTNAGLAAADTALANARASLKRPARSYVVNALKAALQFRRDVNYVVDNDHIHLIDEGSGRRLEGRSLQDGLHQAIEAKEGVTITEESSAALRISRQGFFRKYATVCGTSGTVAECRDEFRNVYGSQFASISRRRALQLIQLPTLFFADRAAKLAAICADIAERNASGQPVLVGTRSVSASEELAALLEQASLAFALLNAKNDAGEAAIIAAAGKFKAITIATNMAGRGSDILVDDEAYRLGGLHVIGTDYHPIARLDRQLIGRTARQGAVGSAQFFCAADDEVLGSQPAWLRSLITARCAGRGSGTSRLLEWHIGRSQRRNEQQARKQRQQMLYLDERRQSLADQFGAA